MPRGSGERLKSFVPRSLTICAQQISRWAETKIDARTLLPVLLRKLVNSTGRDLRRVDFPGYDNGERKGWDGIVETLSATQWIPAGLSCWEFGVSADPRKKANADYAARCRSVSAAERARCTFVFVTPHNWKAKAKWVEDKSEAGKWKAIKVLDASDLEQWLEDSLSAHMWLAEQLGVPIAGLRTLEQCWARWAEASDPPLMSNIFASTLSVHAVSLKEWLEDAPARPFIVVADSRDEALAFLACLVQERTVAQPAQDAIAVFESAETLRMLAASSPGPIIPIVCSDDGERELAPLYRRMHCIVVRPRNAVDSKPDISLGLMTFEAFERALASMGFDQTETERLARESGRSPTILRRRLSKIDAIRIPLWASDLDAARTIIPMALIGAWNSESNADREVMSMFRNGSSGEIETNVTRLLQFDDSPVWAVGRYRGVASKNDALFAIAKVVTAADIDDFFFISEYVLAESDPALELPEDRRWAASIYGKVRNHSSVLRSGVCETLVLFAVHGNDLFRERLGIDVAARVGKLVRALLTPLTLDGLHSHERDLPGYAEAAPDEFLEILENDLRQPSPVVYGLLRPAQTGVLGNCPRTGLLWALECIAWNPRNLVRVSVILAELSCVPIDDNWANKPIASLKAIFRAWMPQTAASAQERTQALGVLIKRFPRIAWCICVEHCSSSSRIGAFSMRPRWRNDAFGAGQPAVDKSCHEFARMALDVAIAWVDHDESTLGDLVECLNVIPEPDQAAVWGRINAWAAATNDDWARARLRERIRRFAFTRAGRTRVRLARDRAREAYARLEPNDLVARHAWLFARHWVDESVDEVQDEDFDYRRHAERIHGLRIEAVDEIWRQRGFAGISALLACSEASTTIGVCLVDSLSGIDVMVEFVRRCIEGNDVVSNGLLACMQGFLRQVDEATRGEVFAAVKKVGSAGDLVLLLKCAPLVKHTWGMLSQLDEGSRKRYWREVCVCLERRTDSELRELIDRLLEVGRPYAAFQISYLDWDKVETPRLTRLLKAITVTREDLGIVKQIDGYHVAEAFAALDGRSDVSIEEMAELELLFVEVLRDAERGIPNLEKQVAQSPALFVQAVALVYKRSDDGQDPPEWQAVDEVARAAAARTARGLLDQLVNVPGRTKSGAFCTETLSWWLAEARQMLEQHGRVDSGEQCIGQWLSRDASLDSGAWPCRAIAEAMEAMASEHVGIGFQIGVHNARGAHWREQGGSQERALAEKYRGWARQRAFDYPYVSGLLESIAAAYDREAEWHDSEENLEKRVRR